MKRFFLLSVLILSGLMARSQYKTGLIIEPLLKTDTTSLGQDFSYPDPVKDEVTLLKITFPPGTSTGWHRHGMPVFAYVEKGELTVELEGGRELRFIEGSSFAEVIGTSHNGVNRSKEELVLIAFYLGEQGKNLSIPESTP